jgi:hypothetical protein
VFLLDDCQFVLILQRDFVDRAHHNQKGQEDTIPTDMNEMRLGWGIEEQGIAHATGVG